MVTRSACAETLPSFPIKGVVLSHEHPLSAGSEPGEVLELLRAFREKGGGLIVDVTPKGCHLKRDIKLLQSLATKAGVEVLCATGYYKEPYLPLSFRELSAKEIAEEFIREIEEGIKGTGVHPAVIGEVGTSFKKITPLEEKLLQAAAIAHRRTGLPILTHTTHGTMGLEQLDILEKAGVDLEKVIIGHCDLNTEIRYHLEIARRGANLGFDTVGKERWVSAYAPDKLAYQSDEIRVKMILELFGHGFGDRIVLSTDMLNNERKLNTETHGKYGYTYIFVFLEKLRKAGLSPQECIALVKDNPRRILGKE